MSRPLRIGDRLLAARMIVIMVLLVLLYAVSLLAAVAFLVHGDHWGTAVLLAILLVVGGTAIAGQRRGSRRRLLTELRAAEVAPADEPELHGTLDRLCGLAGIAKPRVLIADTDLPNALAIGDELCVTRGLLARLTPAELEAVLAHELGHLAHRDGTVLEYAAAPGVVCGRYFRVGLYVLFGQTVYWLSTLLVLMLSRARELSADRAGAMLTGRPSDLAAALVKLSRGAPQIPAADLRAVQPYQALLCVEMPGARPRRLSAHPPLDARLRRLATMSASLNRRA
ncbi:MAG TPA: M48 family metalloprotease [Streptosporangiaceae bacterium]|nr:M48 family metalloprotease [Streptosporangiaceae bacterium]